MAFDSGMPIRLGALATAAENELQDKINQAFADTDPVTPLENAARAQGADPRLIQQLDSDFLALRRDLSDAQLGIGAMDESAARSLAASLAQRATGLRHRAETLAGKRSLTGPVLWGAAIVLGAVGVTYAVWRMSKKRRRR